jgi:RNA polymerase sigma-B factor
MPADVEELFVRWQTQRDRGALDELVERYLPLARKLARRYAGREPYDDLVQVASVGLLKALERFDPQRGNAFSSFAVPTILGELKRYFRDTGWFAHVPRGAQELALKVEEAKAQLSAKTGRSPTVQELAQHLAVNVDEVVEALEAASAHHAASLDSPVRNMEGEKETLADTVGAEDQRFENVDALATIGAAADELPETDRLALHLYYLEDWTQSQIAEEIGVSQMQTSRILRRALDRVRELTEPDAGGTASS